MDIVCRLLCPEHKFFPHFLTPSGLVRKQWVGTLMDSHAQLSSGSVDVAKALAEWSSDETDRGRYDEKFGEAEEKELKR